MYYTARLKPVSSQDKFRKITQPRLSEKIRKLSPPFFKSLNKTTLQVITERFVVVHTSCIPGMVVLCRKTLWQKHA